MLSGTSKSIGTFGWVAEVTIDSQSIGTWGWWIDDMTGGANVGTVLEYSSPKRMEFRITDNLAYKYETNKRIEYLI